MGRSGWNTGTTFAQSDDLLMVHLHLACFRGLSSLNPFSLLTAWRQLLQNSQYQSCQELEDMDATENIFGDHYGTSVVSPARILCLCFTWLQAAHVGTSALFRVFRGHVAFEGIYFFFCIMCQSTQALLPLSLLRLVCLNFCLTFSAPCSQGLFAFSLSRAKEAFLCLSKNL